MGERIRPKRAGLGKGNRRNLDDRQIEAARSEVEQGPHRALVDQRGDGDHECLRGQHLARHDADVPMRVRKRHLAADQDVENPV